MVLGFFHRLLAHYGRRLEVWGGGWAYCILGYYITVVNLYL